MYLLTRCAFFAYNPFFKIELSLSRSNILKFFQILPKPPSSLQWHGYIKDYEGGTLMECRIHPGINYSDIPGLVRRQKEALEVLISSRSQSYR